ncbi:PigN-domain-containing protein [Tilletiaria anomala UBC 951]|uniref:GPI ethanolamine phosphate transferase 1 n=1 Tax=Tilletiaria anomala (strain ATCC 24038 / CBS 436.72 / UBC 951) TaxID=1037660 RepID=A0A066VM07_TILAU|nr:PigN-domain-containing protein [Tilletiaria anomala UBC 951]KDN39625.1 PigN-domain-containing protein [Tilletiaria anomala UBC 951]
MSSKTDGAHPIRTSWLHSTRSLMVISFLFHLLYTYSVCDIYFTSPVVHPIRRFTLNDTYIIAPSSLAEYEKAGGVLELAMVPVLSFKHPSAPMPLQDGRPLIFEKGEEVEAELQEGLEALNYGQGKKNESSLWHDHDSSSQTTLSELGAEGKQEQKALEMEEVQMGGFMGLERYRQWKSPADRLVLIVGDGLRADTLFKKHPWHMLPAWAQQDLLRQSNNGEAGDFNLQYNSALSPFKNDTAIAFGDANSETLKTLQGTLHPAAPFLHHVAINRGPFGVSHTRVPTESRPGHVALIAGMYEDVSAVTKGWKLNPVQFDSVFNQSTQTWAFGSPDILPMFAKGVAKERVWMETYSEDEEDFTKDATNLDLWVLGHLEELFSHAQADKQLKERLHQPGTIFFLHLLGLDTTGHTYRPHSTEYVGNTIVVDAIAARVEALFDEFYDHDNRTAYVFTADHGMSTKGNHGDGDPDNTRTPLIAWGSGVARPTKLDAADKQRQMRKADAEQDAYYSHWVVGDVKRNDVDQADVASLIASLIGAPFPGNLEGHLPLPYLNVSDEHIVRALLANTLQVLEVYRTKHEARSKRMINYIPFESLDKDEEDDLPGEQLVHEAKYLVAIGDLHEAVERIDELFRLALEGNRYLQTYDWLLLCTIITLGYLGSILYGISFLLQRYFLSPEHPTLALYRPQGSGSDPSVLSLGKLICVPIFGALCAKFTAEGSPLTYYVYAVFPALFWTRVIDERAVFVAAWRASRNPTTSTQAVPGPAENKEGGATVGGLLAYIICSLALLELIVVGYLNRVAWTIGFLVLGTVWPIVGITKPMRQEHPKTILAWMAVCFLNGMFTVNSLDKEESIQVLIITGMAFLMGGMYVLSNANALLGCGTSAEGLQRTVRTIQIELGVLCAATIVTTVSAYSLQSKRGLPLASQVGGWLVLAFCLTFPFAYGLRVDKKSGNHQPPVQRIAITIFAFAPLFILLSIRDEALFFGSFALLLAAWTRIEGLLYAERAGTSGGSRGPRLLAKEDVRIALFFLFFLHVAFFGTGNIASISSFYLSPVYRLVPVFSPFLMAALLILKIMVPFLILCSAFQVLCVSPQANKAQKSKAVEAKAQDTTGDFVQIAGLGLADASPLVLSACIATDVLALNFLYAVRDTGSWLEIGQTITHFAMANLLQVFMLGLTALSAAFIGSLEQV